MRLSFPGITLLGLLVAPVALARPAGIIGYSGAPPAATCDSCHTTGVDPTSLTITGPDSLNEGEQGTYQVTVVGAGVAAGFNLAASAGTLEVKEGQGVRPQEGQLTHSAPKALVDGQAVFEFFVRAPASGTTFTLYTRALTADGMNGNQGESSRPATKDITITKVVTPLPPSSDGGTTPSPDAGTTPPKPAFPDDSTTLPDEPTGGCAAAGGLLAPVSLLFGLLALRRKRAKSRH